jgi:hypothetical protein
MTKPTCWLLFLCFWVSAYAVAQAPLTYQIRPGHDAAGHFLSVTVSFDADERTESRLYYENNQFGEPDQMKYLGFSKQVAGVTVTPMPDSNFALVKHEAGRVVVDYRVYDRQGSDRFYDYCCHAPIIRENYFHVLQGHLLM